MVSGFFFPSLSCLLGVAGFLRQGGDALDVIVPKRKAGRFLAGLLDDGSASRRGDELRSSLATFLVAVFRVVGAVAHAVADLARDGIDQAGELLAVARVIARQAVSKNFVRRRIDGEMQLAPRPPLARAVFPYLPFPLAVDL